MNTSLLALAVGITAPLVAGEVRLITLDGERQPLPGVAVTAAFGNAKPQNDVTVKGLTDSQGRFSARGAAAYRLSVKVQRDGFYGVEFLDLDKTRDHDLTAIMRPILNPVPLYADVALLLVHDNRNPPPVPRVEGTYAFDFEVGELLPPYGKGRIADVQVQSRAEMVGWRLGDEKLKEEEAWARSARLPEGALRTQYGIWRCEHVLTFPGKDAGFVQVSPQEFQPYGQMMLPHEAPSEGYQPVKRFTNDPNQPPPPRTDWPTTGYFLRTRVKHDEQGRMVSAHYSKVMGEFTFVGWGGVLFRYLFNPTPNDRNLEFDRSRNLFQGKKGAPSAPFQ